MTKAEACIWKYVLSKKQMMGYSFRRQRPLLKYIVDFICLKLKLVIEIDGYSHQLQENEIKDQIRQKEIESAGFHVLRFKDREVLNEISLVRNKVYRTIELILEEEKG
jgi:very-short-patch-repair endonuclease